MSDIRFNNWLHQSGTGGVYQDGSGNVGIGTSVPSATLDVEGTINANTAVISGNLTVEGVLTYDDVTSIDSVGVVTARDGIHVTSGSVGIGTDNPTSALEIRTTTTNSATHYRNNASNGGAYFGVRATDLGAASAGEAYIYSYNSGINLLADGTGDINFATGGTGSRLHITSAGLVRVPDSGKFVAGSGDDLQIFHGSNLSYLANYTGELILLNQANDSDISIHSDNGSGGTTPYFRADGSTGDAILYHYGTEKLATKSTGIEVSGATKTDTLEVTQEYPTIRPTLDLNFAATKVLDDRITFTRDSLGTYVDDMGIVRTVTSNVPRFDHSGTGECLGLLIEQSRTNLNLYSHLDGGNWTSQYATSNNNVWTTNVSGVTDPAGNNNAAELKCNGTAANWSYRSYYGSHSGGTTSGTTYTFSLFVKPNGLTTCKLGVDSAWAQGINTFTLTGNGSVTPASNTSATIEYVGNGWYRCSTSVALNQTASASAVYIDTPGDGTSGIYVWGAQFEEGAFPTSYIPTSGSTVTRDDDDAVIKGTNFSDIYNETEGTIFSEFSTKVNTGTTSKWAISLRDPANNNNFIAVKTYAATLNALQVKSGGSTAANIEVTNSVVIDQFRRVAASFKVNDFDAADGGTLLTGDTSGAMPTGITQMDIGRGWTNSDQKLEGHIKSIKYYRTKLPDAQLQGLTQQ